MMNRLTKCNNSVLNSKAFTLIELLAVIVVLSVITIIAIPIIANVIDSSKIEATKDSIYGVASAAKYKYMNSILDDKIEIINVECNSNGCYKKGTDDKLDLDNNIPYSGAMTLDINGNLLTVDKMQLNEYVCYKEANSALECINSNKLLIINYELNDNTIEACDEIRGIKGETYSNLCKRSKDGYAFVGWYLNDDFSGEKIDESSKIKISGNATLYAKWLKKVNDFSYTGGGQEYKISESGKYKLEIWGAQGATDSAGGRGGYGSYTIGNVTLNTNDIIYIYVGGSGGAASGGYNGGGSGQFGGGGATHIATRSGLLSSLSSYKGNILVVAGGGAGNDTADNGGDGGGYKGTASSSNTGKGGTQTAGGGGGSSGSFGQGGANSKAGGGGGGWWGGGSSTNIDYGGGGGSGYIGNTSISDKHMTCYNCSTSNEELTKTISTTCHSATPTIDCAKEGNGYARITYIEE